MREALSSLTTRGRAFLAGGVTVVVAAVVAGQSGLVRVGVLLIALPLLTAAWMGRARYRIDLTRTVAPQLVPAGQPARVTLTLTNRARTPTGTLLLEDQLPYVLGTRPRFVIEGIGHGWRRHAAYQVRSDVRGVFQVGPMSVRVCDPFGMVEIGRAFRSSVPLTVTPRTVALPSIPVGGAWTGSGDNRPRAFATGSAEDVTVREYRRGDDLRRVHWPSSARVGELMVRREEQPWQSRATVFLDNRVVAHRGQGIGSSLEAAVSVAASVAVHLAQRGYAVRLVTASGDDHTGETSSWHARSTEVSTGPLLEALAVVRLDPSAQPEAGWLSEAGQGGLVVAVLGSLRDTDRAFITRLQHHATTPLALALDVDAWAPYQPSATSGSVAAGLDAQGWRAVGLGPRDRIDTAWQELGRLGARRTVGT